MPTHRPITITSTGFTSVLASIFCRRVEIVEDGAAARVGLKIKFPTGFDGTGAPTFSAAQTFLPGDEPIIIQSPTAKEVGGGDLVGRPAQVNAQNTAVPVGQYPQTIAATTIFQVQANAGSPTIWVDEYEN